MGGLGKGDWDYELVEKRNNEGAIDRGPRKRFFKKKIL